MPLPHLRLSAAILLYRTCGPPPPPTLGERLVNSVVEFNSLAIVYVRADMHIHGFYGLWTTLLRLLVRRESDLRHQQRHLPGRAHRAGSKLGLLLADLQPNGLLRWCVHR